MGGGGILLNGGRGILSRACRSDYSAGRPIVPAILSRFRCVYICIPAVPANTDPRTHLHTHTTRIHIYNIASSPDNYSGQLDIPRAYKHARTHTSAPISILTYLPIRSSSAGVPPIWSLITRWSPIARETRLRAILEHPRRQHIRQRIRSSRIGYKFLTIKFG